MADMDQQEMTDALREEIEGLTSTDRATVLLLLLGEQEQPTLSSIWIRKRFKHWSSDGKCC